MRRPIAALPVPYSMPNLMNIFAYLLPIVIDALVRIVTQVLVSVLSTLISRWRSGRRQQSRYGIRRCGHGF